jgi:O-methyltransferase involved in polyketide biosynthesis
VSETALWALHNRATEAARPDGVLVDPDCMRIHAGIDYDYARQFGPAGGSLAARAAEIDRALREWLVVHPTGCVVSLGEGLETQASRVDNGRMRWLSVDLPASIRLREHFLPPTERFRTIAVSALDPAWMDAVDPADDIFIVAQGLLMYLPPDAVVHLLRGIADRFAGAHMVFDVVPRWFSRLTLRGLHQTPHYRLPPMPWGINRNELVSTLQRIHPRLADVTLLDYRMPRGIPRLFADLIDRAPVVRHEMPSLVSVTIGPSSDHNSPIPLRKHDMTTTNGAVRGATMIGDALVEATRTAGSGSDLALAAGHVIAKRVALGVAAAMDPLNADRTEFERMVPEKMEAFTAAGMILVEQSNQVGRQISRLASDAVLSSARATFAMAGCATPVALAAEQGRFAREWFDQATAAVVAMGMLALRAHDAAMDPIRRTVAANAERLAQ